MSKKLRGGGIFDSYWRCIFLAGNIPPDVLTTLKNKGHENFKPILSDPVRVEIMAKQNEQVVGYADNSRGASLY